MGRPGEWAAGVCEGLAQIAGTKKARSNGGPIGLVGAVVAWIVCTKWHDYDMVHLEIRINIKLYAGSIPADSTRLTL